MGNGLSHSGAESSHSAKHELYQSDRFLPLSRTTPRFFAPPRASSALDLAGEDSAGGSYRRRGALGDIIACGNLAVFGLKKLN